jgi:hypothetical protein
MKTVLGWVIALAALIGLGIGIEAAAGVGALSVIPGGSHAVNILIGKSNRQKPTYSGTVAGEPLSGTLVPVPSSMDKKDACAPLDIPGAPGAPRPYQYAYSGTYNGEQYTFAGCLDISIIGKLSSPTGARFAMSIHGTIDSVPFSGSTYVPYPVPLSGSTHGPYSTAAFCSTVTTLTPKAIKECDTLPFSGQVGTESVTGSVAVLPVAGVGRKLRLVGTVTAG